MNQTVGIAEMIVTNKADDVLVTYSLGSCVGIACYDPEICVGSLIHCMLPLSKIDPTKAKNNPYMFTDTGVSAMLQSLFNIGAQRKRLVVKVAGGSSLLDEKGMFKIGERNYTVLRKVLWKNNIMIDAEDVGGNSSRTMYLHMNTGETVIKSGGVSKPL